MSDGSSAGARPPAIPLTSSRMTFAAIVIGSVSYGIYVVLAGICIHFLLQRRSGPWYRQVPLLYIVVTLVVFSIYFVSTTRWSETVIIETTDPAAFATELSSPLALWRDTTYSLSLWLADSLIIYRLYVVWGKKYVVMIVPVILYIAIVTSGIALLVITSRASSQTGTLSVTRIGTFSWSTSVALNVLCTVLIAGRLISHQRYLLHLVSGSSASTSMRHRLSSYSSIAAIFAESAALYSIVGIIYIPIFASNSELEPPFAALWGSVAVIAPNLIILRIALGNDASRENQLQRPGVAHSSYQSDRTAAPRYLVGVPGAHSPTSHGGKIWPSGSADPTSYKDIHDMVNILLLILAD
ncbi:hypothetical protein BU17DRAFT_40356 [Hysterangium stoloniferum]|nr:hypothetical protein BU17DRAFT_40356 [Hysterangium stoloniferum]